MRLRRTGIAVAGLAASLFALAGCEEHKSAAVHGAPEYLHQALSGDIQDQDYLASCYEKAAACPGFPVDPAMACAWRGVRLASGEPSLSLSDSETFANVCSSPGERFRQRASIALIDLTRRVYGRSVGDIDQMTAGLDMRGLLYPSINTVREQVNLALAGTGTSERLPAFAPRRPGESDQPLAWSSCGPSVCLEGFTPAFGGGVISYRVTIKSPTTSPSQRAALAAKLAAAGLGAPSAADSLSATSGSGSQITLGPVCWVKGQEDDGRSYAGAARAPCRPVQP